MNDGRPRYRHNSTIRVDPEAKPLSRGAPPKRRTRPTAKNAKRNGHRFPKTVDESYRRWIRRRPCLLRYTEECVGEVQACHVKAKGAGGPDRKNLWPGCVGHHDESHRGVKTFAAKYGLDLASTALELDVWYDERVEEAW